MIPMDIRFNKAMPIALTVVGVFLLLMSFLTGQLLNSVLGVLVALLGVLMLVNPMLRIESHEVQVRNQLGMVLKRYPVSSPADLRFDGNALHHLPSGKKIIGLGFMAHSGDVEALRSQVPGRTNR